MLRQPAPGGGSGSAGFYLNTRKKFLGSLRRDLPKAKTLPILRYIDLDSNLMILHRKEILLCQKHLTEFIYQKMRFQNNG